jgi:hypothetical protein
MQIMMYIFLRRNKDTDVPYIIKSIIYLISCARANANGSTSVAFTTVANIYKLIFDNSPITKNNPTTKTDSNQNDDNFPSIFFFPEGTDLSEKNKDKSNSCMIYTY